METKNFYLWRILAVVVLLVILGLITGFYKSNETAEAPVQPVAGDTVAATGTVTAVDAAQIIFDGPYVITIKSADGSIRVISLPSMGLPICPAYQNKNIIDVSLVKAGDTVEVNGTLGEDGSVVPCESADHYLRIK